MIDNTKTPSFHRILSLIPVYFLVLLILPISGCSFGEAPELITEREERNFQRGKQLLREGRRPDALAAFLSVIEKRREAPESHLEAGELFRIHMRDPIAAIYHYRKFLEQSPNSQQAPHVSQLINTAKKDFAAALPAHPMENQLERLDLLDTVERLTRENRELKLRLEAAHREREQMQARPVPATASPQSIPPPVAAPSQPASQQEITRIYTVVPGDTLSHISGKVFGTTARWREIFDANRDVLPNENSLRIGMQLRIPE